MKIWLRTVATLLLVAGAGQLPAQTAAPAQAAAPAPKKSDPVPEVAESKIPTEAEVVKLSPFEVSTSKDTGYQATETLAGSRIRTDLKDVGSAVSVYTKDFLQDIGATDNGTLLQFTPNAEVAGTRGTYAGLGNGTGVDESATLRAPGGAQRVRGLAAADNTRDFFASDIPWDAYIVDRIDIARGPNSFMFGLGSPAGIVNASLRNAEFRNKGSVDFRAGSYGSTRGSIDINQVIIPKVLSLRIDALTNKEKYEQKPAFQNDRRFYAALRFDPQLFSDPSFHTSFKVKFENGDIKANRPRVTPPNDSITPWFRPVNATSLSGGMGKLSINNAYEIGSAPGTTSPWLAGDSIANQQQPIWFTEGASGQLIRIYGGYVNTGALNASGNPQGSAASVVGQRYATMFYGLNSMSAYATNAQLAGYSYGQYRNASLTDASVFDFYTNLIDGPNKSEWEHWNAYNFNASQTAFDDRLGIDLSYDSQKYVRGGQALIGNPTINIDILRNFQDLTANPNYGRPYVVGGPGSGNSYASDRKYTRASVFGEARAADFLDEKSFLAKLLGKHRFNGVFSNEEYQTENRRWQMYANDLAWSKYKLQGATDGITNLAPVEVIYLGSSLANASSASGANIGRIQAPVTVQSGPLYHFASTWKNPAGVNYSDPWNVPANLAPIFNGVPYFVGTGTPVQLTQISNPANYVGWNSNFTMNPLAYNLGQDPSLLTGASKGLRDTKSYSGSWQAFLLNEAIVPTLGWRYDEVSDKGVTAPLSTAANSRGALNLDPSVYTLPTVFPANQIFKNHSTAGGVVFHLNKFFGENDPLPINVSLSYNKSNNFSIVDTRRDIYGNPIPNPTGKTKDYGILLSTKDGKYSLRAVKYETSYQGANTQLDSSGLYNVVRTALNWRNIKTYYMSGYNWASALQTDTRHFAGLRWMWDPAWVNSSGRPVASGSLASGPAGSTLETQAQADAHRDASIAAINEMQKWLSARGFFTAWNYGVGPTVDSALQTRGQYESAPKTFNTDSVYDYRTAPLMQGFAVTADTQSKGYEFELTANPTPNWRLSFNASMTEAIRTNVGGAVLDEFVGYMDTLMAGAGGDMIMFNSDYSAANQLRAQAWNPWRGQYTLMKLQAGAAASELRKWRYNMVTNYTFRDGALKGVGVGGGYRWQDKVVIGYPVIPGTNGQASFDLSQPYYGPTEGATDLWASYERKIMKKYGWKIQLNVRNAFNKDGLIPISVQPDGQTWATVRTQPVREWFVTNTFSF
jgi:outer membrane receptor protein involved in Fe transport